MNTTINPSGHATIHASGWRGLWRGKREGARGMTRRGFEQLNKKEIVEMCDTNDTTTT